jgi:hypothetical protein
MDDDEYINITVVVKKFDGGSNDKRIENKYGGCHV